MQIVVTGHKGFIGGNLTQRLQEQGHVVVGIDLKTKNDVRDIEKVVKWKPDVIYHLAAQSRVQPSFDNPAESVDTNVSGTRAVLDLARKTGAKVIYAGSSSKHHDPYDSPYATTKYLGEELCKMYRKCFDVDVEIARFYNVYGPGEALDPKNGNVIGIWRWCVENKQKAKIVGDGEQRRDFIHVDDIVNGLIMIADSVSHHEDAWELGTGTNYSINQLADMFYKKFDLEFEYVEDQKGNYRETLNENTDAYNRIGWKPTKGLTVYIKSL